MVELPFNIIREIRIFYSVLSRTKLFKYVEKKREKMVSEIKVLNSVCIKIQNKYLTKTAPYTDVLLKTCSADMQQIYRRSPIQKCDFNKVATQLF